MEWIRRADKPDERRGGLPIRLGFTGRALDATTGEQYNNARWYDSVTGRWQSEDPSGLGAGDANLYRYCGNGPTNGVDPGGEARWNLWLCDIGEVIGKGVGAVINL